MATDDKARQRLVQFINRRILDPVLRASEKKYSASQQKLLETLKKMSFWRLPISSEYQRAKERTVSTDHTRRTLGIKKSRKTARRLGAS
jgi:hypothetical protein